MLGLLIASAVGATATPMVGLFRCGIEDTRIVSRRGGAFLTVGRAQYVLRRARSGSGARWTGNDGLEFWEKGGTAMLKIGRRPRVDCIAITAPKPYRAVGQEPGWLLDIDATGRTAVFRWDFAQRTATERLRPWSVAPGGDKLYTSIDGRFTVRLKSGGCQDAMSGQDFADTVTVRFRGTTYDGCGGPAPMTQAGMVEWIVDDIGGTGIIDSSRVTISIDGDRIAGRGGCNRYSGRVDRSNTAVKIGPLVATRMACAPALMTQEARFLAVLEAVTSITASDGAMILSTADGRRIVARRA